MTSRSGRLHSCGRDLPGQRVHVGDFVETKNAVIWRRARRRCIGYLGTRRSVWRRTWRRDHHLQLRRLSASTARLSATCAGGQRHANWWPGDHRDVPRCLGTTVMRDVSVRALVLNPKQQAHREGWSPSARSRRPGRCRRSERRLAITGEIRPVTRRVQKTGARPQGKTSGSRRRGAEPALALLPTVLTHIQMLGRRSHSFRRYAKKPPPNSVAEVTTTAPPANTSPYRE